MQLVRVCARVCVCVLKRQVRRGEGHDEVSAAKGDYGCFAVSLSFTCSPDSDRPAWLYRAAVQPGPGPATITTNPTSRVLSAPLHKEAVEI